MAAKLDKIVIYPIQCGAGIVLSHAAIYQNGLQFDRQFMLTDFNGKPISADKSPNLRLFSPKLTPDGFIVTEPNGQSIAITCQDFSVQVELWNTDVFTHIASIKINRWFSSHMQQDVQLRWQGTNPKDPPQYLTRPLSFAHGYPFLLINQASFDYVAKHCQNPLVIEQLNGNFIIHNAATFAENNWKTIKIGDIIFELIQSCPWLEKSAEIDCGVNMIAVNAGTIHAGDNIQIITKRDKICPITPVNATECADNDSTTIEIQYKTINFKGNRQETILEQLEQQQIAIPYSCRAGICGRCQIELIDGQVTQLTQHPIKKGNKILACSCLPKGNIKIR